MPITVRLGACDPCYLFHDATTATAPFLCPLISSLSFAFGPNTVSISSNRSVGAPLSSATLRKRYAGETFTASTGLGTSSSLTSSALVLPDPGYAKPPNLDPLRPAPVAADGAGSLSVKP